MVRSWFSRTTRLVSARTLPCHRSARQRRRSVVDTLNDVYTIQTVVQPVVQPVVQRVVSCTRSFSSRTSESSAAVWRERRRTSGARWARTTTGRSRVAAETVARRRRSSWTRSRPTTNCDRLYPLFASPTAMSRDQWRRRVDVTSLRQRWWLGRCVAWRCAGTRCEWRWRTGVSRRPNTGPDCRADTAASRSTVCARTTAPDQWTFLSYREPNPNADNSRVARCRWNRYNPLVSRPKSPRRRRRRKGKEEERHEVSNKPLTQRDAANKKTRLRIIVFIAARRYRIPKSVSAEDDFGHALPVIWASARRWLRLTGKVWLPISVLQWL